MSIANRKPITEVLADIKDSQGIDAAYSHFANGHRYPHLTYIGSGQVHLEADGTAYWKGNTYQVELYYKKKDPALEDAIEAAFLAGGWNYTKSEDAYLEDERIFLIYYELS